MTMTRSILITAALALTANTSAASDSPVSGSISLDRNFGYQGLTQGTDTTTLSATARYRGKNFVAGIWAGEYELPWYEDGTGEIDWFLGYHKRLDFDHRIETSLWHYTYLDDAYDRYAWTQWITSYHLGRRFTVTVGLSDNLLSRDEVTTFGEFTARHGFGPVLASLSFGRNNLSNTIFESVAYARLQASYGRNDWSFHANYTWSRDTNHLMTDMISQQGLGLGISYRLP